LLQDKSAAFFATGNVAISRRLLLKAGELLGNAAEGPFDADFSEYGWEDLELGVRLKELGARIKHVPSAIGYHWHPAFSVDQIPKLVDQVNFEHLILFSVFEAVGMSSAKATARTAIAFKECTALVDVIFYMWTNAS
jgi:hypothetical protein